MKPKKIFLLASIPFIITSCAEGQTMENKDSAFEAVTRDLENDDFAGSILVGKEGEVLFQQSLGYSNEAMGEKNEAQTLFDIGSISKDFTKAAILKLLEENKISLDQRIGELLEDLPKDKKDITVRQLLYHTAGLGAYHDSEGDFEKMSKEEALEAIMEKPLLFNPGLQLEYSNSGYTVLAAIVESVTKRDFTEFVKEEVIKPCGKINISFYGDKELREKVAKGYNSKKYGNNSPAEWGPVTWSLMGSGGLISSTGDYYKWLQCLEKGKIISPELVENHFSPFYSVSGSNDFGFNSMRLQRRNGHTLVVFSNNNYDPYNAILPLIEASKEVNLEEDVEEMKEAISRRIEELATALEEGKENLEEYLRQSVNPPILAQVHPIALTHELIDVQQHLEGEISVKEIQSLDSSIKNVILWNEETGKTASILVVFSWEKPYKINVIYGTLVPDSRKEQEARNVIAQSENKWNVPTGVELTSVLIDLFETFEKNNDDALLQFVDQKLGSQLKGDFPINAHMSYLKKVRDHLGSDSIVTGVLHRNSEGMKLLLKTREGKEYILNVQTAPQESGKLGGLQLAAK